jgi:hypothetical protein
VGPCTSFILVYRRELTHWHARLRRSIHFTGMLSIASVSHSPHPDLQMSWKRPHIALNPARRRAYQVLSMPATRNQAGQEVTWLQSDALGYAWAVRKDLRAARRLDRHGDLGVRWGRTLRISHLSNLGNRRCNLIVLIGRYCVFHCLFASRQHPDSLGRPTCAL